MTPLEVTSAATLGGLLVVGAQGLWRALRPVRIRCAWCGAVRVSAKGQACPACLASVAREGRAAPADWPEA